VTACEAGFDGAYKVGVWTPVRLTIDSDEAIDASIELTTPDGDGVPVIYRDDSGPLALAAGETSLVRYVKFGRSGGPLTVALYEAGKGAKGERSGEPVFEQTYRRPSIAPGLSSGDELIVTVGDDVGLDETIRRRRRSGQGLRHVAVRDPAALPDRWYGYEAVDVLVVADSSAELLPKLSSAQFAAIHEWVLQGGRLVFAAGASGQRLLAADSPWRLLAPGEFRAVEVARRTGDLETYAGATARLDKATGPASALRVARLVNVRGKVEAYEGRSPTDEPWIVRFPLGFGEVTFVAIDLAAPPISTWPDRPQLVAKLLHESFERASQSSQPERSGRGRQPGYEDLSAQLRGSLDQFQGVRVFAFSAVAALLIAYILLIGPADYFLLKRFNKLEWTWLSFPLVVLGFCLLAWALSAQWRSPRLRLNQLDLVDVDLEHSRLRGVSWTHLYSPRNEAFDLSLEMKLPVQGQPSPAGALLSWQGSPEEGRGVMNGQGMAAPFSRPYLITIPSAGDASTTPPSIEGVPVQISATKSLIGTWWGDVEGGEAKLTVDENGMLHGQIANPLDVDLVDCRIFFGRLAYQI
jgi:hypothetical protein